MGKEFCYSEVPLEKRKPCKGRLVETVERRQLHHLGPKTKSCMSASYSHAALPLLHFSLPGNTPMVLVSGKWTDQGGEVSSLQNEWHCCWNKCQPQKNPPLCMDSPLYGVHSFCLVLSSIWSLLMKWYPCVLVGILKLQQFQNAGSCEGRRLLRK